MPYRLRLFEPGRAHSVEIGDDQADFLLHGFEHSTTVVMLFVHSVALRQAFCSEGL